MQSSSQALGGQGKAFLQVASKDPFQVQGTLTELQKSQIQKDQTFTVTAKANNKKKWTGKITEVSEFPTSAEMAQAGAWVKQLKICLSIHIKQVLIVKMAYLQVTMFLCK